MEIANGNQVPERRVIKYSSGVYIINIFMIIFRVLLFIFVHSIKSIFSWFIVKTPKNIANQLAIVTGGGNGLGREIALRLAKEGCNILIADIDLKSAEKTAADIQKLNVKVKVYKVDVSNWDEVNEFKENVLKEFGTIDILVNNAGILTTSPMLHTSPEVVKKTIDVNLVQHVWMCQAFLKSMIDNKKGHIVAINSIMGLIAGPRGLIYCATKYGLTGFIDSLQLDLIIKKQDFIKLTTVHPYFIETNTDLVEFINKYNVCRYIPAIQPSNVADTIVKGILKEEFRLFIPGYMKIITAFITMVPDKIQHYCVKLFFSYGKWDL